MPSPLRVAWLSASPDLAIERKVNDLHAFGDREERHPLSRMVKKLDLLESNHGCGLKGLSRESIPKRK
jgi:hypothetical protein